MAEYETIKSQVQQARAQLTAQKRTVESEEERIRKQERLLTALQTKKPQRKLMFQVSPKYHSQLQRHQAEQQFKKEQRPILEEVKKKLREYKQKVISPYESQVRKAEGEIRQHEEEKSAFDQAHSLYRKWRSTQDPKYAMFAKRAGGTVRKYFNLMETGYYEAKEKLTEWAEKFKEDYPSEKLDIDWWNLKIGGVSSEVLKMSFPSYEAYQKEIAARAPPQFAYKHPITGELFSYAPGFAPEGFVPVAITPKGKELPFVEQFKLRAERPELFEKLAPTLEEEPPAIRLKPWAKKVYEYTKEVLEPWTALVSGITFEKETREALELEKKAWEKTLGYVPEPYIKKPKISDIVGVGYTPIAFRKPPEERITLEEKAEEEVRKDIAELAIQEKVEPEFAYLQSEYDARWSDKIAAGEITHEGAVKKFEQSAFYKKAVEKFNKRIQEEYKKAKAGKIRKRDIKIVAYGLGAEYLPKTPLETVFLGAKAYAFVKVAKAIPAPVWGAYFAYRIPKATYEVVSPKTMPIEKLMAGAELAAITGIGIYAGVKYARAPVLTTKEIAAIPKLRELEKSLRISPTLERQIFTLEGEAKFIKDLHRMAKLDEQIITGRRVIVTTKIRKKLGLKELYGGIPYSEPRAYGKALKKLQKYGATEVEARAALRYYQPRALMSEMKGVAEMVYGAAMPKPEIHIRKAVRITTPEQRIIDEALGIKTRIGKRKVELIAAKGMEVGAVDDATLYRFVTRVAEGVISKKGIPYVPARKVGKVTTTYEQISGVKPEIKLEWDKVSMEILKEASKIRQIIPPKRAITRARGRVIKYDIEREIPTITYDVEKIIGMRIRKIPTYRKKEPIPKLDVKELIKDLEKIYGKPGKKPRKIITAWDRKRHERRVKELKTYLQELSGKERAELARTAREIYGAPVVTVAPPKPPAEAVVGGIPKIKPTKDIVKDISKIEAKLYEKVRVGERLRLGVGVVAREKERLKESARLGQQMAQVEKQALKEALQLGQVPKQIQKLKQVSKMQLKQALIPKQLLKTILTPPIAKPLRFKTPPPAEIKFPVIPFPDIDISKKLLKKKLRKRKRKKVYAYTPSFAAKALGMKPIKLGSDVSIKKLLKKMLTGLEVREPVVVTR